MKRLVLKAKKHFYVNVGFYVDFDFLVTVNISIFRATFLFKHNLGLKYGRYCRGGFFYVSDSDIPVSSSKVTLRPYPYTVCPFKRGIYTVEDTKKSEFLG